MFRSRAPNRQHSSIGPTSLSCALCNPVYGLSERMIRRSSSSNNNDNNNKMIPKPGSFTSDNQRPITCLNTIYKWFTSCLLEPMNHHLDTYKLMEIEQRGAKVGFSGTMNNLLIDRMITEDCHQGKRNFIMAWVDVAKAYDSIDHEWLHEMMILHRFPTRLKNVTSKLSASWNTRIQCKTDKGAERLDYIRFRSGLYPKVTPFVKDCLPYV